MPFEITIQGNMMSACYDGKPYFQMESRSPSFDLMLQQSRIAQYHPLRKENIVGVLYVDQANSTINNCATESDVPSGAYLYQNWLLTTHLERDKEQGYEPLKATCRSEFKIKAIKDEDDLYEFDNGFSMKREYETLTPSGCKMHGRWVLRDCNGAMVEFDKYSNDIASRHSLDLYCLR